MEDKTLHLLILEDNPDDAELMVKELEREGFTVEWSRVDTEEGFREALSKKPDLILVDYSVPSFSGLAALEVRRKLAAYIPSIVVSGTIGEEAAVECMKVGATDYVLKDRLFRLVTVVKRALKEAEEHRARKQAEKALLESEEKYRSLTDDVLDSSAVGIFILDSDFRIVWVNQALEDYFGLKRNKIIGKDKRQLIRERIKDIFENPDRFANKVFDTYDDNTYIERFECHVLPNDERKERWLEHRSQPIQSGLQAGGRIEHYYDITELKRAEEQLKEYAEHLERMVKERTKALDRALYDTEQAREKVDGILKAITDGLIVTDRYDRVVLMNSAVEDLLEVRLTEAIGRPIDFAIRDDTLKSHLKTALEKKKAGYRFDVQLPGKDKEHPKIIKARTSIIKDKEGGYANMVIIMYDIT